MNKTALLEFMRQHSVAVQASVSAAGQPQAAVIGMAVTEQFEIVFDTLESTRKARNLRTNPKVALVIGGLIHGDERSVQFEGEADEPHGTELDRLRAAYYGVHPDGPLRRHWPGLIYVRARPTWIRYSNYNASPPQVVEFRAADLA